MSSSKRSRTQSESSALLPLITPRLPQVGDRRGSSGESTSQLFERIQKGEKERRSFRDRRATPRVAVGITLETEDAGTRVMAQTYDLSTFGLSIRAGQTPARGKVVSLRLFLPDDLDAPLQLKAEVLGPFDEDGGVRMRFVKPDIDAVRRIHRLVS
ncbi:MAG: PilZ domain-containing protein [Myxococcales bacterium]|nr:PilZ domain-containing protein [Myxococcales bacterium]